MGFHVAMYPWLAVGHLTPFLHLANKLANKGHRVSFLIPTTTRSKLEPFNLHPDLIGFVPITIPCVDGLPPGAETTSDVPSHLIPLLKTAMDHTQDHVANLLRTLKVQFVFFDFAHWIPALSRRLGIKSVMYCIITPATIGYTRSPTRYYIHGRRGVTETDLTQPPPDYPVQAINLYTHEVPFFYAIRTQKFGCDLSLHEFIQIGFNESDAVCFRAFRELEGVFIDYLESIFNKHLLLSGPGIPDPPTSGLDGRWAEWLDGFKAGSVIYCALGSECTLNKHQFQELVLGLEATGMPFLGALKVPSGMESLEEALPKSFERRNEGKGVVHGGWLQQHLILEHPSVGCFITHCGSNSLWEGLVNKCQLVFLPNEGDQVICARFMSRELKIGVEIEKGEEDGLFTRESVCKAVKIAMDQESETARELRTNHDNLRELVLSKDLGSSYIDRLIEKLQLLLT